jgi:hypothetical protein
VHRIYPITSVALVVVAFSACGGGPDLASTVRTTPAAARSEQRAGAITVRGDYAPDQRGPYALHGRYSVRFTQRGAGVDFAKEVPFTAHLETVVDGGPGRTVPLFKRAAASGSTTIRADGRFALMVDYGDSPYAIVLTPLR